KTVRRMMYGKRQRLREGKAWGKYPFEYYLDKKTAKHYVKDGWEWVIPFIDDLFINKGLGMRAIANELNKISKTPTNSKWNDHLVYTRLTSKAFHGLQEKVFSNNETITANVFEPLRTEETYNLIQKIRKKRSKKFNTHNRTSTTNINLLKYVHVTCGYCNEVIFIRQVDNKEKPRYIAQHGKSTNSDYCKISINAKRYEYNIIKALRDILSSESLSEQYIKFE